MWLELDLCFGLGLSFGLSLEVGLDLVLTEKVKLKVVQ